MIFNIHKPVGMSSFDVVRTVRKKISKRSVGHAGTLDPFAEGVLVVGVDEGTKLLPYLQAEDKEYKATLKLGVETDSLDREGKVISTMPVAAFSMQEVQEMLHGFVGTIEQQVPRVSAVKINGERAYAKARREEDFVPPLKRVTLHEAQVLTFDGDELTFRVRCGKGFYVRSLGHDLAKKMGTVGHLTALCRERSGRFALQDAVHLESVEFAHGEALLKAISWYPEQELTADEAREIRQGKKHVPSKHPDAIVALHHDGKLVAMAQDISGRLKVLRGFTE